MFKQINKENESDKANNKLGQQIPNSNLNAERCSETRGTHKSKVERRTEADSTDTAEVLLGDTCNEVAQGERTIGLVDDKLSPDRRKREAERRRRREKEDMRRRRKCTEKEASERRHQVNQCGKLSAG